MSFEISSLNQSILAKHLLFLSLIFSALICIVEPSYGELCRKWDKGENAGQLDSSIIKEASGIAVSSEYPGRLYHVNDSGGGPYFYITDMSGNQTKKVKIEGYKNKRSDFEDLGLGPCATGKTCLFIADIGDNRERRKYVEVIAVEELEHYGGPVTPVKALKLVYPDRAHNAEGLAVHPNGDIYILTKEEDLGKDEAYPSKLYRLEYKKRKNTGKGPLMLEYMGEIDIPSLAPEASTYGQLSTSFDISPDGKRFLILTYEDAFEFNHDLSVSKIKDTEDMKEGIDYSVIGINSLPQQESVSYLPDGSGFIYSTEYKFFSVPIVTVSCLK